MTAHNILPFRAREPDGNAAARLIRERAVYEPMLPNEIADAELADSKARGWRIVGMLAYTVSAFLMMCGVAYLWDYIVGSAG